MRRARGTTTVEFALVGTVFVVTLMAITGFSHWIFTLEQATDATRAAARVAVVCDLNDTQVRAMVQARVPQLSLADAQVSVQYFPAGCGWANCQWVRVGLAGATYAPWFPLANAVFPVPPFSTSLPRESMQSTNSSGEANPVCS